MLCQRAISRDLLHFWNQVDAGNRQNRRVERLANVASCFGSVVVVEKRGARSDIQQHQAAQEGQRCP